MGNSRWRLETALNYLGEQAAMLGLGTGDLEILVADWGSEKPLHDAVVLAPEAHRLTRFIHVPSSLARAREGDSPFPEVLALNVAARRAGGDFIGRIDQDTLIGSRFLRWFFDHAPDSNALYFANRRELPYHFAAASPPLGTVQFFVTEYGERMPVLRTNKFTGHVFWTSWVGIWLASRAIWHEAAGYDERLLYYNWMETDMILRLRETHPVVDLGAETGWDFYHLEHYHPIRSRLVRGHARTNPGIDISARIAERRPSGDDWGLARNALACVPASRPPAIPRRGHVLSDRIALMKLRVWSAVDDAVIAGIVAPRRFTDRVRRVMAAVQGRPAREWPGIVLRLWRTRVGARR
jgi:hypothetical protein